MIHDAPFSGPMGRNRTTERIRDIVWWPHMSEDVATYVKGCDACQRHKRPKQPDRTKLESTPIPAAPLVRVQIDFIGPFQPSVPRNYRYVLAIQDFRTRNSLLVPTMDCTAETAAQVLVQRWVIVLDVPEVLQSDQDPHLTGIVFRQLCTVIGINQAFCSPNHPQSNGQIERQNLLTDNVRCACATRIRQLGQMLLLQFSMRITRRLMQRLPILHINCSSTSDDTDQRSSSYRRRRRRNQGKL